MEHPKGRIREFFYMAMRGDETIDDRPKLFQKQREAVEVQMRQLEQTLEVIHLGLESFALFGAG